MFKSLDQEFTSDLEVSASISPPEFQPNLLESAFGRLDKKDCRKTFWLLIATLNAAYPDHDFSQVKAEDFHRDESARSVLLKMSEALELNSSSSIFASSLGALSISPESLPHGSTMGLSHSANDIWAGVHPSIKHILDPAIDLSQCEVYSYYPDPDSDPHAVDSDDFDDTESVASSIYGTIRSDHLGVREHEDYEEATMWAMDEVNESPSPHPNQSASQIGSFLRSSGKAAGVDTGDFLRGSVGGNASANVQSKLPQQPTLNDQAPISSSSSSHRGAVRCEARKPRTIFPSGIDAALDPEEESAGGLLWSSHYFFYNRKMKRILFISIWGRAIVGMSNSVDSTLHGLASHTSYRRLELPLTDAPEIITWPQSLAFRDRGPLKTQDTNFDDTHPENKRRLSIISTGIRGSRENTFQHGSECVETLDVSPSPVRPNKRTRRARSRVC